MATRKLRRKISELEDALARYYHEIIPFSEPLRGTELFATSCGMRVDIDHTIFTLLDELEPCPRCWVVQKA